MKFLKIVEEIQNKPENIDYLVLIRCGIFFYGVGKDAVLLREQFGLNNICISKNICKCAIPVAKIDKFIRKIIAKNIIERLMLEMPSTIPMAMPVNAECPSASEKNAILLFTIMVPNTAKIGVTKIMAINAFFIKVYCINSNGKIASNTL